MRYEDNRFKKWPGGAVPQSTRTPAEQLKYLDEMGFVAKKERAKLAKKMERKSREPIAPAVLANALQDTVHTSKGGNPRTPKTAKVKK